MLAFGHCLQIPEVIESFAEQNHLPYSMCHALFKPVGGLSPSEWRWRRSEQGGGRWECGGEGMGGEGRGETVMDM